MDGKGTMTIVCDGGDGIKCTRLRRLHSLAVTDPLFESLELIAQPMAHAQKQA
jgi:hypothetical protein